MWPSSRHSSGTVRLADAEIVAPSSNHSDGLPAQAPLMTAASTAIAHGSSNRPRGRAGAGSAATSERPRRAARAVDIAMMLVTVRRADELAHQRPSAGGGRVGVRARMCGAAPRISRKARPCRAFGVSAARIGLYCRGKSFAGAERPRQMLVAPRHAVSLIFLHLHPANAILSWVG